MLHMDSMVLALSTDDRATVLKDAALGNQLFMFYVMCKTSCFTQLPLLWLGISSFDWSEARQHAAVCQRLHALQAPGADHHLSRTLHDTLGEDLNQFTHGQPPFDSVAQHHGQHAVQYNQRAGRGGTSRCGQPVHHARVQAYMAPNHTRSHQNAPGKRPGEADEPDLCP